MNAKASRAIKLKVADYADRGTSLISSYRTPYNNAEAKEELRLMREKDARYEIGVVLLSSPILLLIALGPFIYAMSGGLQNYELSSSTWLIPRIALQFLLLMGVIATGVKIAYNRELATKRKADLINTKIEIPYNVHRAWEDICNLEQSTRGHLSRPIDLDHAYSMSWNTVEQISQLCADGRQNSKEVIVLSNELFRVAAEMELLVEKVVAEQPEPLIPELSSVTLLPLLTPQDNPFELAAPDQEVPKSFWAPLRLKR